MALSTDTDREYGSYLTWNGRALDSQNARILAFMSTCHTHGDTHTHQSD